MPSRIFSEDNRPIYILWLLRNGTANDWPSIARKFGVSTRYLDTIGLALLDNLRRLREVGLITFQDTPDNRISYESPISGRIELTKNYTKLLTALDVSLTELAKLSPTSIVVKPYFGRPNEQKEPIDLFVLMPFEPALKPVYEDHIVNVVQNLGLTVARGDNFFTVHSIISDIWAAIYTARAIIADCTGRNPNVFYEIGLAHVLGKPVILITQSSDDVPFDIRHLRYIQYEYTPRGMRIFEEKLADTLKTELGLEVAREFIEIPVVYIVADNTKESRNRLDEEFSGIKRRLEPSEMEERLPWLMHFEPEALQKISIDRPKIIHITGHNGGPEALIAQGYAKKLHRVKPDALITIFRSATGYVDCVVLSACFSQDQAKAIASQIRYVIGIPAAIGGATTDFAAEFYQTLWVGLSIEEAYENACNQLRLQGIPEHLVPVLFKKS
jgi:hypothetical protein